MSSPSCGVLSSCGSWTASPVSARAGPEEASGSGRTAAPRLPAQAKPVHSENATATGTAAQPQRAEVGVPVERA
ncbi:hypothetical protein [Streptomyces capitiformicae]|uniref:hypothetical protein n=1 Tax=Streptomyces capitiformicae TaxID=2014920 RepID=UPI001673F970|nr:hypothetical protein [Streptomyces capitiformicae]